MVDILAVGLERIAEPGAVVYVNRETETRIGGHPVDVAIDLVKLGMSPDEVAVAAAVGTGIYGNFVRDVMAGYRFGTFLQTVESVDTGKTIVLKLHGEDRRFFNDPGANWLLDPDHVTDALRDARPEIFCLRPGYSGMDLHLPGIVKCAGDALVFLDVMQPHPTRPHGFIHPILPSVDIVHGNERELLAHADATELGAAVAELLERGVKLILLTLGEHGARAITATESVMQPGFVVEGLDTTGCGDAFCAAVTHTLLERDDLGDVGALSADDLARLLLAGQAAGACVATTPGCVDGLSRPAFDELFAEQGSRVLAATSDASVTSR
jgi:sugar/nucleoside kinase (ribokinase family)